MIQIKNVSTSRVIISLPNVKFNRTLTPGRVVPLTKEEYEEFTFDPGCAALLKGHYIQVFGVDEDKQSEIIEDVVDAASIQKMLLDNDITAFAKFIPNATAAEKESAVTLAVEHKITNAGIVALIKKYCDVDIINAISIKHDAEEK